MFYPCEIKQLPDDQLLAAAEDAIRINPANAPTEAALAMASVALQGEVMPPQFLASLVSKYWGQGGVKLTVGFMDNPTVSLRNKIIAYANKWSKRGNVEFVYSNTDPQVRIARARGGYWSYLGVDILRIPKNQQTMNLEGFTDNTRDEEFDRVVCHEFGHTLSFPHEHLRRAIISRLDVQKTIAYFRQRGWDEATTRSNVLTALEDRMINATPNADQTSIMAYQLPGEITRDGQPITGGSTINESDHDFISKLHPKPEPPPPPSARKVYIALTGQVTEAKFSQVATTPGLTLTLEKDPGAMSVSLGEAPPNGGTGMLGKLLALWAAIRSGDWATVLTILSELAKAQADGQITKEEDAEVQKALCP